MTPPAFPPGMILPPNMGVHEPPPQGCEPDAYKLFVGNLPKSCTEEEIRPYFESVGKVSLGGAGEQSASPVLCLSTGFPYKILSLSSMMYPAGEGFTPHALLYTFAESG
jgi:RNA recognition motif-containing protein